MLCKYTWMPLIFFAFIIFFFTKCLNLKNKRKYLNNKSFPRLLKRKLADYKIMKEINVKIEPFLLRHYYDKNF